MSDVVSEPARVCEARPTDTDTVIVTVEMSAEAFAGLVYSDTFDDRSSLAIMVGERDHWREPEPDPFDGRSQLSATEAAKLLSVSRSTIRNLVRSGRLTPHQLKTRGKWYFHRADLEAFVAAMGAE
jgi:excisionase family DNA binding protein